MLEEFISYLFSIINIMGGKRSIYNINKVGLYKKIIKSSILKKYKEKILKKY